MKGKVLLGFFLAGILTAAVVIYLTPLKNINVTQPIVKAMDPAEFYEAYQKNPDDYFFIDIRPSILRYESPEGIEHNSIFLLAEEFKTFPRDKTIVLFCEENISQSVAYGFLEHQGFRDIRILDGGRAGWKEAGLPLVKNENYSEEASPFLFYLEEGGLLPRES